ncbi:hypothetical protein SAMN05444392_10891 [Seinonella peptonophila]|uniref:Uncharacterized protein n=1 Tax=Seinonella peptonophila TaxID=112248 RepID=A0A1M4Z7R1_9BACL|nr:hypothetical protein [Seinonella peptonophila]SHF14113.1 hypothetical protein SAMN05444392_10891 [Seinonella peptonophila]
MDRYLQTFMKESMIKENLVSVHAYGYQRDEVWTGYINLLTENQFLMKHVTEDGLEDGFILGRLDDVFQLTRNGQYEQELDQLYKLQDQQHNPFVLKSDIQKSNLFREAFIAAKKNNFIVNVCFPGTEEEEDMIVGFVRDVYWNEVVTLNLTSSGTEDGESIFYLEDVVSIHCHSRDMRKLKLLKEYHEGIS